MTSPTPLSSPPHAFAEDKLQWGSRMISPVPEALAALRAGKMIVLVDDEHRENEGDLVLAAEFATPEAINFMTRYGRGLVCMPMSSMIADQLNLPPMTSHNRSPFATAFTVSIEAATGVSTGISVQDRARTIQVAADPKSTPADLVSPGHIFPLRAKDKGVLERRGQTEGSIDLMRLAGLRQAAVICEIMNDTGAMSRREELLEFAKQHQLLILSIQDIVQYRIQHECLIEPLSSSTIPLKAYGSFVMTVFKNDLDVSEHFILANLGSKKSTPLVRIHSECITGDLFGSLKCDCGDQLDQSLRAIAKEGGVLIYLRQEGRGIGLANKLKAYALQEQGLDTVEANQQLGLPVDARDYTVAYQILKYLKLDKIRMITNNPRKILALTQYGIDIEARIDTSIQLTCENKGYLHAKREKLGHYLNMDTQDLV